MRTQYDRLKEVVRRYTHLGVDRFRTWRDEKGYGENEAIARLLGSLVGLAILVPFSLWLLFQLGSILVQFVGWVFTDQPEPPPAPASPEPPSPLEKSMHRVVPAVASLVSSSVVHWLDVHTQGLPIKPRDLGLLWTTGTGLLALGALARIRGAQIGFALVGAATSWIAWQGTTVAEYRPVAAGTVALVFAVVGMVAFARTRMRVHNFIDARPRGQERPVADLDRERTNAEAMTTLAAAAERMADLSPPKRSLADVDMDGKRYSLDELNEAAQIAQHLGLQGQVLPSDVAGVVRMARDGNEPDT